MRQNLPMGLVAGLLAVAVAGCALFSTEAVRRAQDEEIPPSHIVPLGDSAVGTRVTGSDLAVVFVYRDAEGEFQSSAIASTPIVPGTNSVQFASGSGLGLGWNTFLYGSAGPGITRVSSSLSDARGGEVVDGVWVIASPAEGVSIGQVDVAFLDASGKVVEQQ